MKFKKLQLGQCSNRNGMPPLRDRLGLFSVRIFMKSLKAPLSGSCPTWATAFFLPLPPALFRLLPQEKEKWSLKKGRRSENRAGQSFMRSLQPRFRLFDCFICPRGTTSHMFGFSLSERNPPPLQLIIFLCFNALLS